MKGLEEFMNKKPPLFFALLIIAILVSACGTSSEDKLSCTLTIVTHTETIIDSKTVSFAEGESVLDILIAAVQEAKLQLEYTGAGATAYVQGINDLYEFDEGSESGWVYTVNGEEIMESAGTCKPQDGDTLIWQYITGQ
jgi:hypothetical protein